MNIFYMHSHLFVIGIPCMHVLPLACHFNVVLLTPLLIRLFVPLSLVVFFPMYILTILDYADDYVECIPLHCLHFNSYQFSSFQFHSIPYMIELLKRGLRTFTAAATDAKRTFTLHPSSRHIGTYSVM